MPTIVATVIATMALAGAARAQSPLASFSVTTSTQQAGAAPDLDVEIDPTIGYFTDDFDFPTPTQVPYPLEAPRSFVVTLPPGLLGNLSSLPTCAETVVSTDINNCSAQSQVGLFTYTLGVGFDYRVGQTTVDARQPVPVINLRPGPGQIARLGIPVNNGVAVVHVNVTLRDTTDYGLTATVTGIPAALPFVAAELDVWGNPSAPIHDGLRTGCLNYGAPGFNPACPGSIAATQPFLVNPTTCGQSLTAGLTATFWGDPGSYDAASTIPATTGCDRLAFSPTLGLSSATGQVGLPDAFTADLAVTQPGLGDTNAYALGAAIDDVTATLPAGVALSPGVASGLAACTDAQFARGSDAPVACPDASKIGTATVRTPLLDYPLTGAVYVGSQRSSDPASGEMYRLFLDATGQGVDLKLNGSVSANPSTGQLTARFPQNPQVPVSSLQLALKGGPRAPLANPQTCGTATTDWSISSQADPGVPVTGRSSFPVSGDCAQASRFTPSLSAGTASNQAGASSPFSFTVTRPDGQQLVSGIPAVSLPLGLNANIASVRQCTDAQVRAVSCPADSQVGDASVTSGSGSEPFELDGQPIYLTGPYRGAPFGLAEVVHALAGPFDLGTVVVRQALSVDPKTARVTIASDPLPTMLGGVPLNLRTISLDIDRPGFMRSPTSCAVGAITATLQGSPVGAAASVVPGTSVGYATSTPASTHLSEPFQAGGCAKLTFAPRLGIALSARHRTAPGSHPRLTATLTQAAGQANLRSAKVALPLSLALDPENSQHVCTVKAAAKIACPSKPIVGSATADTRILPHPLTANVYLVQGLRYDRRHRAHKTLPTLLIPLRGADGVAIDLTAKTSVDASSRLVTTFASIPDAAISRFRLTIAGGPRGILAVTGSTSLCRAGRSGDVVEYGQNGKGHSAVVRLGTGTACRGRAARRR